MIISISAISANEINETDIGSSMAASQYDDLAINDEEAIISESSDTNVSNVNNENNLDLVSDELKTKSVLSENDLSQAEDLTLESSNNTNSGVLSSQSKTSTSISIKNSTVIKGDYLYIYLKDSSNKAISGESVIFKIKNSTYTKTTDSKGMASLKINSNPAKYNIKVSYNGSDVYKSSMKDFTLTVSKVNTKISVSSSSIVRGRYLYAYLKDKNGNALYNKKLTIKIGTLSYSAKTDKNGRVAHKISLNTGTYSTKISFAGDSVYTSSSHSFSAKVYRIKTVLSIPDTSIVRGNYLNAYLKDNKGNALANQKVLMIFNGQYFDLKTNKNGRVALKIRNTLGKVPVKLSYAGSTSYASSSKSETVLSYTKKTAVTIPDTTIVRGNYLNAYLKDSSGNPIANKTLTVKFSESYFYLKTNANGKVGLKINTKLGKIPVKVSFAGSTAYSSCSKSSNIVSYMAKTKITSSSSSVTRGKVFYAYLKDSSNRALSNQKLTVNFGSKTYTRISNSDGKIGVQINDKAGLYAVKVNYANTTSYASSSKSMTVNVLSNATAKIIAKNQTVLGEYSVRLTDAKGNPLSNQTVSITTTITNRTTGSGIAITKKTIVLDSDNIYSKKTDLALLNSIASILRSKGYTVIVNSDIGPNAHCNDIMGKYSNACIFCIFGGVDSGMFVDMSSSWYQYYLKKYNNEVVLGFTYTQRNLATDTWLERAHDDDYSPSSFTGLAYPGTYLNQHGMDYVYGNNAAQLANNFLNYAVKGLSIGLNNTIPTNVVSYTVTTNSNGYATISGLTAGNYTVISSYSNKNEGYVADTVKSYITVK